MTVAELIDLDQLRTDVRAWTETLAVPGRPGAYRFTPGGAPGFYATADMAILRWCLGDDLRRGLGERERRAWIDEINAYQSPGDGRYGPDGVHHVLHSNGTALNALAILGGTHRHPVTFYRLFATAERIGPWLSSLEWGRVGHWNASHYIWGGPVCLNNSSRVDAAWCSALFGWLAAQHDPATGSWPKEFPTTDPVERAKPLVPLGCAVHLWPLWRHRGLAVPGVRALAELVLRHRGPTGDWGGVNYGSLDALYVLQVAAETEPDVAERCRAALADFIPVLLRDWHGPRASFADVHRALCWVSCWGYLQRALPDRFTGSVRWGDIFDRREIYALDAVHPQPF